MAKVVLDHQEDGICLMYGLAQLCEGEKFSQTALMLTPKEILFYDDNTPNQVVSDAHYHQARLRIVISELKAVVVQKIKFRETAPLFKIMFVNKNVNLNNIHLFCSKSDMKIAKKFFHYLHSAGLKIKHDKFMHRADF